MGKLDSYYAVLGLKPEASQAEVKQAYRALAKTWHPDRFAHDIALKQQAEEKIKAINEAYQLLKHRTPEASTAAAASAPKKAEGVKIRVKTAAADPETYYVRGVESARANRWQDAIEDFSVAIRMNPNYAEAYYQRGLVRSLLGLNLSAEDDFAKAKALNVQPKTPPSKTASRPSRTSQSSPAGATKPPTPQRTAAPKAAPQTSKAAQTRPPSPTPSQAPGSSGSPQPPPPPPAQASPASTTPSWHCVKTLGGQNPVVTSLALTRDSKVLASGSFDKSITLWNLKTGKPFCQLTGHEEAISALAFSADGQLLVSTSQDWSIKLWHVRSGSLVRTLTGHSGSVSAIALSPDRQTLISSSQDNTIRFWNLSSGELIRTVYGHNVPVRAIALTPDGQLLIAGSDDCRVCIYQTRTGELLRNLAGQISAVFAVAVSPDGRYFATAGQGGEMILWADSAIVTGNPLKVWRPHAATVRSLAFSPDGQTLASASDDRTVRLWQVPSREAVAVLADHSQAVTSVVLDSAGQVISSSADRTIRIWAKRNPAE